MKTLYFPLATPTVEVKVTAKGTGGEWNCRAGFLLPNKEKAEELRKAWKELLYDLKTDTEAEQLEQANKLDAFLRSQLVYITKLPLLEEDPELQGEYKASSLLDTRKVLPSQVHLFDEGTDTTNNKAVLDEVFSDLIAVNPPWNNGFTMAFGTVLANIPVIEEEAAAGN